MGFQTCRYQMFDGEIKSKMFNSDDDIPQEWTHDPLAAIEASTKQKEDSKIPNTTQSKSGKKKQLKIEKRNGNG